MAKLHSFSEDEMVIETDGNNYIITGWKSGIKVGDTIAFCGPRFTVLEIEYYADPSDCFIAKVLGEVNNSAAYTS